MSLTPADPASATLAAPAPDAVHRLAWIDYAKAVGIVLVVFGHASRSIERTAGMVWNDGLRLLDTLIYTFHIPLFFVLAGFTVALLRSRGPKWELRGLLWGICVPYVIWTTIWVSLKSALPEHVNAPVAMSDLVTALWRPIEHLWFLQHLLLARLVWMALDLGGPVMRSLGAGSLAIAVLMAAGLVLLNSTGAAHTIGSILINAGLFGCGLIWLPAVLDLRPSRQWVARGSIGAGALLILGVVLLRPQSNSLLTVGFALLGSAAVIGLAWLAAQPRDVIGRVIAFVGEASLAIYLIHPIVIGGIRALLGKAGLLSDVSLLWTGTVLGVLIPALLFGLVLYLSQAFRQPIARWIGLGTATRSHYLPARDADALPRPRVSHPV